MQHILKNEFLTIRIDEHGAELTSILNNQTGTQYLWNADPAYWKRHSPVLFPFVGSLKNKSYVFQGKTYPSLQHGFARDMKFDLQSCMENEIWFSLEANDETMKIYPFHFRLELGYRLQDKQVAVLWKVINNDRSDLFFSIGAHPAFNCPIDPEDSQNEYFLAFDKSEPIPYQHINENALMARKTNDQQNILSTDQGILPIDPHIFDYDALIFENSGCHKVSILDPARVPYVTVTFDAQIFGLWSPAKKNAPFICIEPWYGRCDAEDFNGTLEEREWGNTLHAGQIFEASYTIEVA